jgi:small subunit ribosomal protein S11
MAEAPKNNVLAMLEANPSASAAGDAAAKDGAAPAADGKRKVKKSKHNVPKARACVCATENNTIVTITDPQGKVLSWASSGSCGFKGARKSTPYAAKVAAEKAMTIANPFGIQSLTIEVKGIGPGREQAIRGLQVAGVNFESITDVTPIAHGGCRPKRPRRV